MKTLQQLHEDKLDLENSIFKIIMQNWDIIQYNIAPNLANHENYNYGVEFMEVKDFGENWIEIKVMLHGTDGSYERVYSINYDLSVYLRSA